MIQANAILTATVRHEKRDGREFLVAPVVMLVEGVVNGERVEAAEFRPSAWAGVPVVLDHPRNGRDPISARDPDILEKHQVGNVYSPRDDDGKLKGEMWVDVEQARRRGPDGERLLGRLEHGPLVEVSTAYRRRLAGAPGELRGERYTGYVRDIEPDSLAVLLDDVGACSIADGCGAPRTNKLEINVPIAEITATRLRREETPALLNLHRHLHGLWAQHFEGNERASVDGLTREDLANGHITVRQEMLRRGLRHAAEAVDGLDRAIREIVTKVRGDTVVVPDVVTIVGSVARGDGKPHDLDILVRADAVQHGGVSGYFIRADDIRLPVRNVVNPDKKLDMHWCANPQGPHGTHLRVADLVLRWREPERVEVNARAVRLDLGCGESKPAGYVGIDRQDLPGVDIVADVTAGLPQDDSTIDEVRAVHVLEDIAPGDRVALFREIWRVLKPGGVLNFEVPHADSAGAEMPFHQSHWTEETFQAFANPNIAAAYDLPQFEAVKLERAEDGRRINLVGSMKPIKLAVNVSPVVGSPTFPKPADKFFTDTFSPAEMWAEWAKERAPVFVEPKYNGFRAYLQKSGDRMALTFEDSKRNRLGAFPDLEREVRAIRQDFILDVNLGVIQGGKWWPRVKLMTLTAEKPKLPRGARLTVVAFDVPYWNEDLTGKPFSDRRKVLSGPVRSALSSPMLRISSGIRVNTLTDLKVAYRRFGRQDGSEGVVGKQMSEPYPWGSASTASWSKIKNVLEVKAAVLEVKRTKGGQYNFRGGLAPGRSTFRNLTEVAGKRFVDLKWSFNSPFSAKRGDIVTFEVEEIILNPDGTLSWLGAKPIDVDKARRTPFAANQVVSMARRAGILQDARGMMRTAAMQALAKLQDTTEAVRSLLTNIREEPTRADIAERQWKRNWSALVAKGEGRYILHGHFPSLTEEEAKQDLRRLLAGDNQYHSDLRHEAPSPHGAWGFSVFEGASAKVGPKGTRLSRLPARSPMRGTFKLEQPRAWLSFAKDGPRVTESVGRVGKDRAKFFSLGTGRYKLTYAREHAFEVVYTGRVLKGRYQINYVPVEGGKRVWMISRPAKQDAIFADEHKLETVVKELKRKGQRWLFWREALDKPLRKIDVKKFGGIDMSENEISPELTSLIEQALEAIGIQDADAALDALNAALADKKEGYEYPEPGKPRRGRGRGRRMIRRAIAALEDEDFEDAQEALTSLSEAANAPDEAPVQAAASSGTGGCNEPKAAAKVATNAVGKPAKQSPELKALLAAVNDLGGPEVLRGSIEAMRANQDATRLALVAELKANKDHQFAPEMLEQMTPCQLEALRATIQPTTYIPAGSGVRANASPKVVRLESPDPFAQPAQQEAQ